MLSLNLDKSKLLMFKLKQKKLNNNSISIKPGGVKLIPSDNVEYLGLHLDKYLSWDIQTNQLVKKQSRANSILSELRHFMPERPSFQYITPYIIHIYYTVVQCGH